MEAVQGAPQVAPAGNHQVWGSAALSRSCGITRPACARPSRREAHVILSGMACPALAAVAWRTMPDPRVSWPQSAACCNVPAAQAAMAGQRRISPVCAGAWAEIRVLRAAV
jgi:hypothetical protein